MKDIIKSSLNTKEEEVIFILEDLLSSEITTRESEIINYIIKSYNELDITPTETDIIGKYPELAPMLSQGICLSLADLDYHVRTVVRDRKSLKASQSLMDIASKIQEKGLKEEDIEALRDLVDTEQVEISKDSYDFSYFQQKYEKAKTAPTGLLTFVQEVDSIIGGMQTGTVSVLAAYVANFKSVWGTNIAYNNTYQMGYNVCVLSLEVPKEEVLMNILCRHSYDPKFSQFEFIPHEGIRRGTLTEEQESYLFNTILPDLNNNSKGKLFILDETDFANMSYSEIRATLYKIDDLAKEQTGTGLDAIIVDHCHLLKYTDNASKGKSENAIINDYVSFFRRLTIKFRKLPKENPDDEQKYSQLSTILLAQTNRKGYEQACKKRGAYNLLALSEANEIERSAYRVMSIWTDDLLKESKEAMVCVLKNRSGMTNYTPTPVYADGEAYVFGDITMNQGGDTIDLGSDGGSLDFDSLFDDSSLGFLD